MTDTDRRQRLGAALVCVLVGGFLAYAVWADLPGLRTPRAISVLAAMVFLLAGAALFLQAFGHARAAVLPIFLLIVAMAGIGGWIGFGPGRRECRGDVVGARHFTPSERTCRAVFGGGALLTGVLALLILRSLGKGRPGSSNRTV